MTHKEMAKQSEELVAQRVEKRLLALLLPTATTKGEKNELAAAQEETREKFKQFLAEGRFEEREV